MDIIQVSLGHRQSGTEVVYFKLTEPEDVLVNPIKRDRNINEDEEFEETPDFVLAENHREFGGPLGAFDRSELTRIEPQDALVEEDQGIQSLILG